MVNQIKSKMLFFLEAERIEREQAKRITDTMMVLFKEPLGLLRDLAEHQNGAPLVQHEKDYNKTMSEVWDFLEVNEPKSKAKCDCEDTNYALVEITENVCLQCNKPIK